jgi:hypothetical protein
LRGFAALSSPHRHHDPAEDGKHGDRPDCRSDTEGVGDDTGQQRPGGEATVPPQAVDTDRGGPPARMGDVADHRQQGRVDHRRARTEHDHSREPGEKAGRGGDGGDGQTLSPHPGGDEPFAPPAVRQRPGEELADTPHRWIDGGQHADRPQGQSCRCEVQREHTPGQPVVEVVDQPRLGRGRQGRLTEAGEGEHLPCDQITIGPL